MGCQQCKETTYTFYDEVTAVVFNYADTFGGYNTEKRPPEIPISIPDFDVSNKDELIFHTSKNDIKPSTLEEIKQKSKLISSAYRFKGLDTDHTISHDLKSFEKSLMRQIEKEKMSYN